MTIHTKGVGRLLFNQERKLGDQRRSDTVVVLSINYTSQTLEEKIKYIIGVRRQRRAR